MREKSNASECLEEALEKKRKFHRFKLKRVASVKITRGPPNNVVKYENMSRLGSCQRFMEETIINNISQV